MKTKIFKKLSAITIVSMLLSFLCPLGINAAALTALSDTMTRLKISTAANHTIVFTTPAGIDDGDTVTLTFANDFDISSVVVGDVTIGGNAPASAVPVGQVLTITADVDTTVAPAGTATIVITNNHITNPTTTGSKTISIAGTFGDTGSIAVYISTDEQVVVTATVDPSITFTLSTTTASLSNITTSATVTDVKDDHLTVITNADNGYSVTGVCNSTGNTLRDGSGNTIAWVTDNNAPVAGTEGWGIKFEAGTGGWDANTSAGAANHRNLSTSKTLFSNSSNPVADDDAKATYEAAAGGLTESGTYTATITYIATGNF